MDTGHEGIRPVDQTSDADAAKQSIEHQGQNLLNLPNASITDKEGRITDPTLAEAMAYGEKSSREIQLERKLRFDQREEEVKRLRESAESIRNIWQQGHLSHKADQAERHLDYLRQHGYGPESWEETAQSQGELAGLQYLIEQEWLKQGWQHGAGWEPMARLYEYKRQLEDYLSVGPPENRRERVADGPEEKEQIMQARDRRWMVKEILEQLYYLPELGQQLLEHQTNGTLDEFIRHYTDQQKDHLYGDKRIAVVRQWLDMHH